MLELKTVVSFGSPPDFCFFFFFFIMLRMFEIVSGAM